jgi:hypothetical protein
MEKAWWHVPVIIAAVGRIKQEAHGPGRPGTNKTLSPK